MPHSAFDSGGEDEKVKSHSGNLKSNKRNIKIVNLKEEPAAHHITKIAFKLLISSVH